MKTLIPWADGVEEMEAVILTDVLRRAGWTVVTAGLKPGPVSAARGVRLLPDRLWDEISPSDFDALVLPGGALGTRNLSEHEGVRAAVRAFDSAGKLLAAVCAAPLVLQAAGVLRAGRRLTSHPAVRNQLREAAWVDERVVEDGHWVTSQGPGTCFEFALALVARVEGPRRAAALAVEMRVH